MQEEGISVDFFTNLDGPFQEFLEDQIVFHKEQSHIDISKNKKSGIVNMQAVIEKR